MIDHSASKAARISDWLMSCPSLSSMPQDIDNNELPKSAWIRNGDHFIHWGEAPPHTSLDDLDNWTAYVRADQLVEYIAASVSFVVDTISGNEHRQKS